jgi:hypothetical protein
VPHLCAPATGSDAVQGDPQRPPGRPRAVSAAGTSWELQAPSQRFKFAQELPSVPSDTSVVRWSCKTCSRSIGARWLLGWGMKK